MAIDLRKPIDLGSADGQAFIKGIQGNIIKGHGRDHAIHLILKMIGPPEAVRQWIAQFATDQVTSEHSARQMTERWQNQGGDGEPFCTFYLSSEGYRYLGFTDDDLPQPGGEFVNPLDTEYFRRGMKNQASIRDELEYRSYNDPDSSKWEEPFQKVIHAMILIADNNKTRLGQSERDISRQFEGIFDILTTEQGEKLKAILDRNGSGVELEIEHFGFQDGISQPLMTTKAIAEEAAKRGSANWQSDAPLQLALAKESGDEQHYGSFLVFRKLEQNVAGFWSALEELSAKSGIDLELAGAMATGRHRNGLPLIPTSTADPSGPKVTPNDFNLDQDPDGELCPFHSHIRKTNPRGDIPRLAEQDGAPSEVVERLRQFERARRIVRRAITYGHRPDLKPGTVDTTRPSGGVGLLFMCFQSNLDQFVIQQEGSDGDGFVKDGTGPDAVIGQSNSSTEQSWPSTGSTKFRMANFVAMKGGEYFFAPSMAFLLALEQQ